MTNKPLQYRQGDIWFEQISDFATRVKGTKPYTSPILAYGEVTGHCHKVNTSMDGVQMFVDKDGDIFIQTKADVSIGHDEHGVITLPGPGEYCISHQREYDWATESVRKVAD